MGFLDKMKSSLNDVSSSVSSSIDNQKTEMKIRDEQKKIDRDAKEIGDIVVRCLNDGIEFNESMVSEQMSRIIQSKRTIAELRGEYFDPGYSPSEAAEDTPEPVQTETEPTVQEEETPEEEVDQEESE